MDEGTQNSILVVLAIIGAFANAIAWGWQQRQSKLQRQQTEKLAHLASDLDVRVHHLAANLDQKIYKLNRVRDLITNLLGTTAILRQEGSSSDAKVAEFIRLTMTLPELSALVAV